jgi:hypothetical protein
MTTITLHTTTHFVPAQELRCECHDTRCTAHARRRTCRNVADLFALPFADHDERIAVCNDCAEHKAGHGFAFECFNEVGLNKWLAEQGAFDPAYLVHSYAATGEIGTGLYDESTAPLSR